MFKDTILKKLDERKKMFEDYLQQIKNPAKKRGASENGDKKSNSAIK